MTGPGGRSIRHVGPAGPELPPEAFAAALAGLPAIGPARLGALLVRWSPAEAWDRVLRNAAAADLGLRPMARRHACEVGAAWMRAARATEVAAVWERHLNADITVHISGSSGYPPELATDHEAPAVLFARGQPAVLDRRRVAIVGTRRCTRYGRDMAAELGRDLAAQGVTVVSGLALGIDGAAHTGALETGEGLVVGVVGSGLDVVYPRAHGRLWREVGERGLLLSEAPVGSPPEAWRFPVRNRIISALGEVLVVVESHAAGGCIHTLDAAVARGRPVMAVPGSVRSSASVLPNTLLAEGCAPVRDALDVLVALGLSAASRPSAADTRAPPTGDGVALLETMAWEPVSFDDIVAGTGLPAARASVALAHLERDGWIVSEAGCWERVAGRH